MAFLTPAQLAKAQAEAEGFQFGPQPALNPANINTQDKAGNATAYPPTSTPAPYYPSQETPKLQLSTRDMAAELANNFAILDNALVSTGPAPTLQIKNQSYTITQADITGGFCIVPIVWPQAFADNGYDIAWSVSDSSVIPPAPRFAVGEIYAQTPAGFTAVVSFPVAAALIQGQEDLVASTTATNVISLVAPLTTLYQVTLYYGPSRSDAGDAGKSWSPTVAWTDPAGNSLTASETSPDVVLGSAVGGNGNVSGNGGVGWLQAYSIPFFVLGGSTISITGNYTGGAFPVNVSVRLVQMPNNVLLPPVGTVVTVEAIGVHA